MIASIFLARRSAWLSCGLLVCLAAQVVAQEPALRTFRDASGRFEIKATVVRVEKETVVLRRETGQEIVVRIDALSPADRTFLTGLASPAVAAAPKTPFDYFVFPTWQNNGSKYSLPGLVVSQQGETKFCATPLPHSQFRGLPLSDEVALAWKAGNDWRLPAGQRVAAQQFNWLFRGNAAELPAALPGKSPELAVGSALTVWSYEMDATLPGTFSQEKFDGKVAEVRRARSGEIQGIKLDARHPNFSRIGIATSADGKHVACWLPGLLANLAALQPDDYPAIAADEVVLVPFEMLPHILAPRVVAAGLALVTQDDKSEFELVVVAQDPLQELKSVAVQMKPLQTDKNYSAIKPFAFSQGRGEGLMMLQGAGEVKLRAADASSAAWKQLDSLLKIHHGSLRTRADRVWTGTFPITAGDETKPLAWDIQVLTMGSGGVGRILPIRQLGWHPAALKRASP